MALKESTGAKEEERTRRRRREQGGGGDNKEEEEEERIGGVGGGGENRRSEQWEKEVRSDPDLLGPHGVAGLLEQDFLEVKVLVVVVGLCAGVADVALGVETLRNLHGVLRPHA